MKPKPHLILAAVLALTGTTLHADNEHPRFLGPQTREQIQAHFAAQRAKKAAEQAEANKAAESIQLASHFYTGKPYDASQEGYTFLFRSYDPELGRWSTTDPSGFPDGANNLIYALNAVTFSLDIFGDKRVVVERLEVSSQTAEVNNFGLAGSVGAIVAGVATSPFALGALITTSGVMSAMASLNPGSEGSPMITEIESEVDDDAKLIEERIIKDDWSWSSTNFGLFITAMTFTHTVRIEYVWE